MGVVGRERGGKLDRAQRMFGPTLSAEIGQPERKDAPQHHPSQ